MQESCNFGVCKDTTPCAMYWCIVMTGTILCIATMYFVYTNYKTVKFSYKYVVDTFPHMVYIFYDMYSRGRKKCYVSCKQNDIKTMQCFIRLDETFTIPKRGTLVVKLALIN